MLFRKFFNGNEAKNSSNGVYYMPSWTTPVSSSGEVITVSNALNVSAIYSAINVKASAIAKLSVDVLQKTSGETKEALQHPVYQLLKSRPNRFQTPYSFFHTMTTHRNLFGIAYVRMVFDKRGNVTELYLMNPAYVYVVEDENGQKFYIYMNPIDLMVPNPLVLSEDEIIRVPYLTLDGFIPKSPIAVARETAGVMLKQQKFLGSFYQNGTMTTGVLQIPTALNKDNKAKIREEWEKMNSATDNAGRIAILDGGLEYKNLGLPLQDAEFIASMNYGIRDIARIFGIPPHLIGDLNNATFSNIEQQSLEFYLNTIQPECVSIEQELNFKLFTPSELKQGYFIQFNMDSALRGDTAAKGNFYNLMLSNGVYSINEIRAMENKNPIDGGDSHRVDLNHISLDIADEYQMTKAGGKQENGSTV